MPDWAAGTLPGLALRAVPAAASTIRAASATGPTIDRRLDMVYSIPRPLWTRGGAAHHCGGSAGNGRRTAVMCLDTVRHRPGLWDQVGDPGGEFRRVPRLPRRTVSRPGPAA
ncbi:hypothetical protein Vwe01_20580 [Micromonospora andamanensis]|nr:hypothetical protein Vwe01_20580 [Micromonospora andamanensis]